MTSGNDETVEATWAVGAVLLDLDGVLVHSERSIERAWSTFAARWGLGWPAVAEQIPGRLAVDTIRALLPYLPDRLVDREADRVNGDQEGDASGLEPVRGMRAFVDSLPSHRWAVVTGCPRPLAIARLAATGYPVPPVLVTAEDVSRGKPSPEGFLLAASYLGTDPVACLSVEDSPPGVAAAKAAGTVVVAVATTHSRTRLRAADVIAVDGTCLHAMLVPASGALVIRVRWPGLASSVSGA